MHDGTIGLDGPSYEVVAILELDDDDFGLGGFIGLLSNTEVAIGFKSLKEERESMTVQCIKKVG